MHDDDDDDDLSVLMLYTHKRLDVQAARTPWTMAQPEFESLRGVSVRDCAATARTAATQLVASGPKVGSPVNHSPSVLAPGAA